MKLVLDIENTVQFLAEGKKDGSPFNPLNKLVSVGYKEVTPSKTAVEYLVFHHKSTPIIDSTIIFKELQDALDITTLLIGHNIKYDLKWLRECGFIYNGEVWDTMVCEYVLLRGRKLPLDLGSCCVRRKLHEGKSDALGTYLAKGINVDEMPLNELVDYGIQDVEITEDLYLSQVEYLKSIGEKGDHLIKVITLMNDFLPILADMESSGVSIDTKMLADLHKEYSIELAELDRKLKVSIQHSIGDRQINLQSPEQRSEFLFSRRVADKVDWKEVFNLGTEERGFVKKQKRRSILSPSQFNAKVNTMKVVHKTIASKCVMCNGYGTIRKYKKDGKPYKNDTKCKDCGGIGIIYTPTSEVAGLKLIPCNQFVTVGGFASSDEVIQYYITHPETPVESKEILTMMARHVKLTSWVNTFINQLISNAYDGIVHCQFNQCITATGRLSSTQPNLQNQPTRDPEFKIKKAFISRWRDTGGVLTDADFGQLEFRIAAYLSQCPKAMKAVADGLDIHALTRDFFYGKLEIKPKVVWDEIDPKSDRQKAKAETFGPLYGKTTEWTKQFYLLFPGIKTWHDKIMIEVATTKELRSPSGRIYAFPDAVMYQTYQGDLKVSCHTQVKNYIVQGFATGDMVLLVLIDIYNYLKRHNAKSRLILQVHDSATTDTHPDEKQLVIDAYNYAFGNVYEHARQRFNIDLNVPLSFDLSSGVSWGEQEGIKI